MRIFLLLVLPLVLLPVMVSAKTIELGFPDLKHRVKVELPDGHDPSKKYPAVLYYHGAGGKPDTSLIQHHLRNQAWIVVGMSYFQLGKFSMSPEVMVKEMTLLRSVKRHLQAKYGMDPAQCYVAGFSKGGWMADIFLQADSSLAGGVILAAGHLDKYRKSPIKYPRKKPVFIGVGRLDHNYLFSLRGMLHHRKMGAEVTMEEWPDLAHAFPGEGSQALSQWFALRSSVKPGHEAAIKQEMDRLVADASELGMLEKWNELRRIRALPYAQWLGKEWGAEVDAAIKRLEAQPGMENEARAYAQHRKLLYGEVTASSLKELEKVHQGYIRLMADFDGTKQAQLADRDRQRILSQIKFHKEKGDLNAEERKKDPFDPVEPKLPENRRPIPRNPLVR